MKTSILIALIIVASSAFTGIPGSSAEGRTASAAPEVIVQPSAIEYGIGSAPAFDGPSPTHPVVRFDGIPGAAC